MRFVKVRILGRAGTTDVQNVLYYGSGIFDIPGHALSELEGLALAVRDAWNGTVKPLMGGGYVIQAVEAQQIDEFGDSNGSEIVRVPGVGIPNSEANTTDSRAVVLIARFSLNNVPLVAGTRRPKRSYLALGPLPSNKVNNDGQIAYTTSELAQMSSGFIQNHLVGTRLWEPYRVGVSTLPNTPHIARVAGATFANKVSWRRSRADRSIA